MSTGAKPSECSACGKGGDDLKACSACKMKNYCGVDCQKDHRPSHEEECKRRARELLDEALFKRPQKQDCPICFLPLPVNNGAVAYQSCCGKLCCFGCTYEIGTSNKPCPFCRVPYSTSAEESIKRLEKRMKLEDPNAFYVLGKGYFDGMNGMPIDRKKGFELVLKAAELGLAQAHNDIGYYYSRGLGVEVDTKKANQQFEMAVIGGSALALYNLGDFEYAAGNYDGAKQHWMVAASAGYDLALDEIRKLFLAGHATRMNLR